MIKTFLKAKHWQLFFLLMVPPILFQIFIVTKISSVIREDSVEDMDIMFSAMSFLPLLMLLIMGVYYGWMWSISIGLRQRLSDELKLNTNWFKICFFYQIIYMFLFIGFMSFVFMNVQSIMTPSINPSAILFIFPLHFIAMACSIYVLYFTAKTIKTAELNRNLDFGQFVGEFFLLWFFPIGIWIIQPKVNQMVDEESELV